MNSKHSLEKIKEEFVDLNRHPIPDLGITVGLVEENNPYIWNLTIYGPKDTPYSGGLFYFYLIFPKNYPEKAPEILFYKPIYHPNVNIHGSDNEALGNFNYSDINSWKPTDCAKKLLIDIYTIFYWPNLEKPHSLEIANEYLNKRELFEKKAAYFVKKYANPLTGIYNRRPLKFWDFSCDENYLNSMKINQKKQLNYDYNGDELINLIIYVNGVSKNEQMIQCKSKEKTRYVIERFKVKYSIDIKLNKDTLFIINNHQIKLDSTIGENRLYTNTIITIIPKGQIFDSF